MADGSQGSPKDEVRIDNKLSELDALLKSEAEAARGDNRASAATRFEQVGMEANKAMEAFLGRRGQGEEEESDNSTRRHHLGHEEERLLEMVFSCSVLKRCLLLMPSVWTYRCGHVRPMLN